MTFINRKLLITLFCVIGFTYHTISLTWEYLSGNTVVNILIGPLFKEGLPAITICPGYMAIDKVAKLSEALENLYQDYLHYINLNNDTSYNSQMRYTHNQASDIIKRMVRNGEIDIGSMFYNFTYNYNYKKPSIEFYLHGTSIIEGEFEQLINHSNIVKMDDGKENFMVKVHPIESMVLDYSMYKCYTFFSHIDSVWKNVKIDFKRIKIVAKFDLMSHPHMDMPVPIFIHSPNDLPLVEQGKLLPLESGISQSIQYSTIKILRLGRAYETDCREYGHGYEFDTRSSCIVSCVKHHHDTICDNNSLPEMGNLVRKKFITKNYKKTITNCTDYSKIKQDALVNCSKHCKFNCQYKYYPGNIHRLIEIEDISSSDVIMEHNTMPDVLIKYIPETILISFVCNFGGLIGMWLGLSFLTVIEVASGSILKLKLKIKLNQMIIFINGIKLNNSRHQRLFKPRQIITHRL